MWLALVVWLLFAWLLGCFVSILQFFSGASIAAVADLLAVLLHIWKGRVPQGSVHACWPSGCKGCLRRALCAQGRYLRETGHALLLSRQTGPKSRISGVLIAVN